MRQFRILIAAHGDLADAFLATAELICGPLADIDPVGLRPDDSPESYGERFRAAAGASDRPLLILACLLGGTPHNVALSVTRDMPSAHLISGVNLAVLIEAAMCDDALDGALVERLVASGREALVDASRLLTTRSR